ncbi:hypothetical protein QVD17_00466 [Tagetes erecta]|uniref:Uncharacterized protein n=1 Tax=Tagetes erecta TaxID=13708 RepID=A0AAD8P7E9_TARER|nr:hypothetical protein QVD17_00466 [Tagetes erecta]
MHAENNAAINNWLRHQLDDKNVFLDGIPMDDVYVEQPPSFIAEEEPRSLCFSRNEDSDYPSRSLTLSALVYFP